MKQIYAVLVALLSFLSRETLATVVEVTSENPFYLNISNGSSVFINAGIYKGNGWNEVGKKFKYIQIDENNNTKTNAIPLDYLIGKYLNGPAVLESESGNSALVTYSLSNLQPFLTFVAQPNSTNTIVIPIGKSIYISHRYSGNLTSSIRGYELYGLPSGWFIDGPEEIQIKCSENYNGLPSESCGIFNYFLINEGDLPKDGFQQWQDGFPPPIALSPNLISASAISKQIIAASNNFGLATKTELTSALAQSRTDGINSVLSNPNLWTLYTTNQISAMAIGDLVLTRTNNGTFVLNYDIEQSEDLVNWTPYQGFAMPLTNLPTNKAFVRIKAKQ